MELLHGQVWRQLDSRTSINVSAMSRVIVHRSGAGCFIGQVVDVINWDRKCELPVDD